MYYYPDNIQESILVFQKGRFDYTYTRNLPRETREKSRIDLDKYNDEDWYLTVWNITNVLPLGNRLEKGIAAFPEEIPRRLVKLYSYYGETVLDPFLGSGTTAKVAKDLGRNSWGYEIDPRLKKVISEKLANGPGKGRVVFSTTRITVGRRRTTRLRRKMTTLAKAAV